MSEKWEEKQYKKKATYKMFQKPVAVNITVEGATGAGKTFVSNQILGFITRAALLKIINVETTETNDKVTVEINSSSKS